MKIGDENSSTNYSFLNWLTFERFDVTIKWRRVKELGR